MELSNISHEAAEVPSPQDSLPATAPASAFARAIAAYRGAKAAEDHFDNTACAAAIRAHDTAEAEFERANPHVAFQIGGRPISTADWRTAEGIRRDMTNVRYLERCCWDDHRNDMAFLDAFDARKASMDALPERVHMDAMTDRSDALCEIRCEARDAVIQAPVASIAELADKFQFLEETEQLDENPVAKAAFAADIARLASGGLN